MKKIYYYKLRVEQEQRVEIPEGARILGATVVKNEIRLYAIVPTGTSRFVTHKFTVLGTGWEVPFKDGEPITPMGSVVTTNGEIDYVWHVFLHGNP